MYKVVKQRYLKVKNFPTFVPLGPFKKNPYLGHLCSLRGTTAPKYYQKLDSRLFFGNWVVAPQKLTDLSRTCKQSAGSDFPPFFLFRGAFPLGSCLYFHPGEEGHVGHGGGLPNIAAGCGWAPCSPALSSCSMTTLSPPST